MHSITEYKQSSNEIEIDNHLGITELASKRSILMKGISSNVILPSANVLKKSRNHNYIRVETFDVNNPIDVVGEQESKNIDSESINFYKSHVDINERFVIEGWDSIAGSIASGASEFFYLEPYVNNPYKFRIIGVPSSLTSGIYATLSKHGLVRVIDGESTDIVTLNQFHRECQIYYKIINIGVFANYMKWKSIYIWRQDIKRGRIFKRCTELKPKLVLLESLLRQLLLYALDQCDQIRRIYLIQIYVDQSFSINDYTTEQRKIQCQAIECRKSIINNIIKYLLEFGESITINAVQNMPDTMSLKKYNLYKEAGGNVPPLPKLNSESSTNDNVGLLKSEEMPLSYTERASIRVSCRRLASVFRLVDFCLRDNYYSSLEYSLIELYKYISKGNIFITDAGIVSSPHYYKDTRNNSSKFLNKHENLKLLVARSAAMFTIAVNLNEMETASGISFLVDRGSSIYSSSVHTYVIEPTANNVISSFYDFLLETLNLGVFTNTMFSNASLATLMIPIRNEVSSILLEDRVHLDRSCSVFTLVSNIIKVLETDFENCFKLLQSPKYNKLLHQYTNNTIFLSTYTLETVVNTGVENIKEQLDRLLEESSECNELVDFVDVGIVRLDFSAVRNLLLGCINSCKSLLNQIIPEWYLQRGEILYNQVFQIISSLGTKPNNLDDFVKMLEIYNLNLLSSDDIRASYEGIMAIRELIEDYQIPLSDSILRQNLLITNVWYQYNDILIDFGDATEAYTKDFVRELLVRIKTIKQPLDEAREFIVSEVVLNPFSDPDDVISALKKHVYKLEFVKIKSFEYNRCQNILKVTVFEIKPIVKLHEQLNFVLSLWNQIKNITDISVDVYTSTIMSCSCTELLKRIVVANGSITSVTTSGNGDSTMTSYIENYNRLITHIKKHLADLEITLSSLVKLQSKSLRMRHIDELHQLFDGWKFFDKPETMVSELSGASTSSVPLMESATEVELSEDKNDDKHVSPVDSDVMVSESTKSTDKRVNYLIIFNSSITEIYERSFYEHNIETSINSIKIKCSAQSFQLTSDKDNKSLFFISNITDLEIFFDDALVDIQSILSSSYCMIHHGNAIALKNDVLNWCELLKKLKLMQLNYLQARVIFTSARTARHLHSFLKFFKAVDDIWREILLVCKAESFVTKIFSVPSIPILLDDGAIAIEKTDQSVVQYIEMQYSKWPKLYLLSKETLIDILGTQDTRKTFIKCRALMPSISDITFDKLDVYSTVAVWSGLEQIKLHKPSSARNSLADWLRNIDVCLSERIIQDIRQYTDEGKTIVDDLRQPFSIEQGRICAIQIKFTDSVTKCLRMNDFTPLMNELIETIAAVTKLPIKVSTRYQRASISNILTLLICNRDTVNEITNSMNTHTFGVSAQFIFDLLIKKIWDYSHNQIKIKHGILRLTYGMKYQGFSNHRLVITPLSTRCLYAINVALQPRSNSKSTNIPFMTGPTGHNKRSMLSFLASELGVEMINIDLVSGNQSSSDLLYIIKATVEAGLWLNLFEIGRIKPELFSILMTVLTAIYEKMATRTENIVEIGGIKMEINLNQLTLEPLFRVACTYDPSISNAYFPSCIRSIFRPITVIEPDLSAIIRVALNIYAATNIERLAIKLEQLLYYFIRTKSCSRVTTFPALIKAIHNVGCYIYDTRKVDQISASEFLQQTAKEYLKLLPVSVQLSLKDSDYLYICERVLDVSFKSNAKNDYSNIPSNPSISYYVDLLASYLTKEVTSIQHENWSVSSVIVLGSSGCGKSTIIDKAIFKGTQAYNGINTKSRIPIPLDNACVSEQLYQLQNKFMTRYPYSVNPYVLIGNNGMKSDNSSSISIHDEAKYVMESIIKNIDSNGPIQVLHMDTFSSIQYVNIATFCHKIAKSLLKPITFVWELVELYHADPYILSSVGGIVPLPSKGMFSQKEVVNFCISNILHSPDMTEGEVLQLRDVFGYCVNEYLEPCICSCAVDSALPNHTLIDNTFKLFSLIYKSSRNKFEVNVATSLDNDKDISVVWTEQSIQRIFVFSCIWTFGMCSVTSRINFEAWFRAYFDNLIIKSQAKNENKRGVDVNFESVTTNTVTNTSTQLLWSDLSDNRITEQIYIVKPLLNVNTSIFDYFLTRENVFNDEISGGSLLFCTTNPLVNSNESAMSLRVHKATIPNHFHSSIYSNHHHASMGSIISTDSYQGCALIVSTSTGDVTRFLQDCMTKLETHVGGHICILGQNGSGKGSLIRQLSLMDFQADISVIGENNTWKRKYFSTMPYRWTCRFKDCKSMYVQSNINSCIRKSSPFLLERNLPSYGTIIIEDVNYSVDDLNEVGDNNVSEWLRYTSTYKHHYNVEENRWGNYEGLFCLTNAISTSTSQMNTRLLRQSFVIRTAESELSSVFCTVLNASFPMLSNSGVADDIVTVTLKLFDLLKEKYAAIRTFTTEITTNNIDSICFDHLELKSLASIVHNIITIASKSLSSLNLFSSNDLVRVWDRVSSDYFYNFNGVESIMNQSVNDALDACIFKYPSFSDLLKRERIKRFEQSAKLNQAIENSECKDVQFTTGFYKNSEDAFIAIQSVDYFRDNNSFISMSPLFSSQFVYMDIQRMASMLSLNYPNCHLIVLNSNEIKNSTSYIIESACKCIHASYYFIKLSDDKSSWQKLYDLIIDSFVNNVSKVKIELQIDDTTAPKVQTWEKLNNIFDLSDLYIITSINMRYSNINMSNIDVRIDPAYRAKYIEFLNNFSCVITYTSNIVASAGVLALSSCSHAASNINLLHIFNNNATKSVIKSLDSLKSDVNTPNYNALLQITDNVTGFIEKTCEVYHTALEINTKGQNYFKLSSLSYKVGTIKMMYTLFSECSREHTFNDFLQAIYISLYVRYVMLLNESAYTLFCEHITNAISITFNIGFTPINATNYLKDYLLVSNSDVSDLAALFNQYIRLLPESSMLLHLLEVICVHYIICGDFTSSICHVHDYSCQTMNVLTPLLNPVLQRRSYNNFYANFNNGNAICLHYELRNKRYTNDLEKVCAETTVILIEPTMTIISDYILMTLLMEGHMVNNFINTNTNLTELYKSIQSKFNEQDSAITTVYDLINSNNEEATKFISCWINISSSFSTCLKPTKHLLDSISLIDYNLLNTTWGSIISCFKMFLARNDCIKEIDKNITFLTAFNTALVVCIKDTLPKYFSEQELVFVLFTTILKLFFGNIGEIGVSEINNLLGIFTEMGEAHGFSLSGLTKRSIDDGDEDEDVSNDNYANADFTMATKYCLNKVLAHTRDTLHTHVESDTSVNNGNYISGLFKTIESDKYTWMTWASNPEEDIDFPLLAHSFSLSWIDKIAIAYFLKPSIVPKVLTDAVVHIGVGFSTSISKLMLEKYYNILVESTQKNTKFQIVRNYNFNNEYKLLGDSAVNCNKIICTDDSNWSQLTPLINLTQQKASGVESSSEEDTSDKMHETSTADMLTDMTINENNNNKQNNMYHIIDILPGRNKNNRYVTFEERSEYTLLETKRILFPNSLDESVFLTPQIPMSALEMSHITATTSFYITNVRGKFMTLVNTGLELLQKNPARPTSDEMNRCVTTRLQMLLIFLHSALVVRFEDVYSMDHEAFIQLFQYTELMVTTAINETPSKSAAMNNLFEANNIINSIFESIYSSVVTETFDVICVKAIMRRVISNCGLNFNDRYEFENHTIFETINVPYIIDNDNMVNFVSNIDNALEDSDNGIAIMLKILGFTSSCTLHNRVFNILKLTFSSIRNNIDLIKHGIIGINTNYTSNKADRVNNVLTNDQVFPLHVFSNNRFELLKVLYPRLQVVIRKLQVRIPLVINMESEVVINNKRRNSTIELAPAPVAPTDRTNRIMSTMKRKAKETKGRLGTHHSIDPLWEYVTTQCLLFNKYILSINKYLKYMLSLSTDRCNISDSMFSNIINITTSLENLLMPSIWLDNSTQVSVDNWIYYNVARRDFINEWMEKGFPCHINFSLLHDPNGLIDALRGSYSYRTSSPIDNTYTCFRLRTRLDELPSPTQLITMNNGCTLIGTNFDAYNFQLSNDNTIGHISPIFTNPKTSTVAIEIFIRTEIEHIHLEDYQCPIFVGNSVKKYCGNFFTNNISNYHYYNNSRYALTNSDNNDEKILIGYIALITDDNVDELRRSIANLYCSYI